MLHPQYLHLSLIHILLVSKSKNPSQTPISCISVKGNSAGHQIRLRRKRPFPIGAQIPCMLIRSFGFGSRFLCLECGCVLFHRGSTGSQAQDRQQKTEDPYFHEHTSFEIVFSSVTQTVAQRKELCSSAMLPHD